MILGQEEVKEKLSVSVDNNLPVLLVGETGTGKTSIIKDVAPEDQQVVRVNLNGQTSVEDFVGRKGLKESQTFWEDGVLLNCMREGHWIVVDEINAALPEILFVLHSLLDDGRELLVTQNDNEIVKPHEDFRFFATMNPVGEYAGTKSLNKSFMSRFGMVLRMSYPSNEVERKIIKEKTDVRDLERITTMIEITNVIRDLKKEDEIFYNISTRDLLQWAHLTPDLGIAEAFKVSVLNKAGQDREIIVERCMDIFEEAEKAFKKHGSSKRMGINYFKNEMNRIERRKDEMKKDIIKSEKDKIKKKVCKELKGQFNILDQQALDLDGDEEGEENPDYEKVSVDDIEL